MHPPPYPDFLDNPDPRGVRLEEPPLCHRCSDSPASIPKLEQHAAVMKIPSDGAETPKATEPTTTLVSLYTPLQDENNDTGQDPLKPRPATRAIPQWMSLLPSNRNAHVRPPPHSALHRRSSFPYFQSTRYSSPFSTPIEWPKTQDPNSRALAELSVLLLPEKPLVEKPLMAMLSNEKQSVEPVAHLPGAWLSSTSFSDTPPSPSHHGSIGATILSSQQRPQGSEVQPLTANSPSMSVNPISGTFTDIPVERSALSRDDPASPGSKIPNSAFTGTSLKRQQLSPGISQASSERPQKVQKPLTPTSSPSEQPTPEVLEAAPHKPALFKELSGFFTSRKQKLVLPSRALERRQSLTRRAGHQRIRSRSQPPLGDEVAGQQSSRDNDQMTEPSTAHGGDGALSRRVSGVMSARVIDGGIWTTSGRYRTCPCRGKGEVIVRQPILRHTMRKTKR